MIKTNDATPKKVLVIANLFNVSPRIPGITTYLPEFNWEATIVTPAINRQMKDKLGLTDLFLSRVKIKEANYLGDIFWFWRKVFKVFKFKQIESITQQIKLTLNISKKKSFIDKLLILYQTLFAYPDSEKTWIKPAFKAASSAIKKEHFDAIFSTSPYPTNHLVAYKIKKEFRIPWLADFRDPWSKNVGNPFCSFRKFLDRRLEIKTMSLADKLVAVAPAYAEATREINKRRVDLITNGFDPQIINEQPTPLTKKFTITYLGTLYGGKRNPQNLFVAIRELINEKVIDKNKVEIKFYGEKQTWLQTEIEKYHLENIVKQIGKINRFEAIEKQRESQILLLIGWGDEYSQDEGVYPGKIFEYFAARRPILVVGGPEKEAIKDLVFETKTGIGAAKIIDIKKALINFYDEYKKLGKIKYKGDLEKINQFSYKEIARKFAHALDEITISDLKS